MNDDELGRHLTRLVPDPAPGYWDTIDRALEDVAEGRPAPLAAGPEAATGGGRRSRVLMVAAAFTVALAMAGGLMAARTDRTQTTTPADQTAPTTTTADPSPSSQLGPQQQTEPGPSGSVADRAPTGAIVVNGDPLAAFPADRSVTDAGSDPAYGREAPGLTGTDFDGTEVRIEPDGRRKAVVIVAHWCPHCQTLLDTLSQLVEQHRVPDDLDLYVVSTHYMPEASPLQPQRWPVLAELRARGVRILRDDADNQASVAYGEGGFPTIVYLDGGDRVVARSAGELDADVLADLLARTS